LNPIDGTEDPEAGEKRRRQMSRGNFHSSGNITQSNSHGVVYEQKRYSARSFCGQYGQVKGEKKKSLLEPKQHGDNRKNEGWLIAEATYLTGGRRVKRTGRKNWGSAGDELFSKGCGRAR